MADWLRRWIANDDDAAVLGSHFVALKIYRLDPWALVRRIRLCIPYVTLAILRASKFEARNAAEPLPQARGEPDRGKTSDLESDPTPGSGEESPVPTNLPARSAARLTAITLQE